MIFEKTATTLSIHASRKLSRHRATTILLVYAAIALTIAFISYQITFSMVLTPLATLLFSFTGRNPAPAVPPANNPSHATHPIGPTLNITDLLYRRRYINYAALPMRRPEADLLLSYLQPEDVLLEWGASATTLALPHLVSSAFSIEHDVSVCAGISSEMIAHRSLPARLRAFCAPVPVGRANWARVSQFEEGTYRAFHNYVDFPRANLSHLVFDKVLINGRARVACALRILPQLRASSLVFLHDFFLRPEHYAAVLPFYDEIARVVATGPVHGYSDEPMGLLVLRPKKEYVGAAGEISVARVNAIYDAYREEEPREDTSGAAVAFRHGLLRTGEGGFDYYGMARSFARETTQARIVLDLVAVPFVALTYLVLRDLFNKIFLEALSSGGRGLRAGRATSLPVTNVPAPETATATAKAE